MKGRGIRESQRIPDGTSEIKSNISPYVGTFKTSGPVIFLPLFMGTDDFMQMLWTGGLHVCIPDPLWERMKTTEIAPVSPPAPAGERYDEGRSQWEAAFSGHCHDPVFVCDT